MRPSDHTLIEQCLGGLANDRTTLGARCRWRSRPSANGPGARRTTWSRRVWPTSVRPTSWSSASARQPRCRRSSGPAICWCCWWRGRSADGSAGPDLDAADAVVASAVAARHVAVLAVSDGPLDEATERWLTRLAAEHPVARGDDLAPLVTGALAERRRCLLNPVTEPGPHDLANEPREGRTLDEVALGDPQPRPAPSADAAGGGPDRAGADEQWNEAVQAWRAQLWEPMVEHLQRALDHRPLDADAGLWLARVLAASLSVGGRSEAVRRATDAARLAEQKGRVHWAAAAWLWVARLDRRVDQTAALDAAGRAADLVPHRAEPWVERALVGLWTGDDERAKEAALVAYRHHERSLHDLLGDTCSPPDPVEAVALEDHVRQASLDRLVQLLQWATRLGAEIDGAGRGPGRPAGAARMARAAVADRRRGLRRARRDVPRRVGGGGSTAQRRHPRQAAPVGGGAGRGGPDAAVAGRRRPDRTGAARRGRLGPGRTACRGRRRLPAGRARRGARARNAIHDRDSLVWGLAGAGAIARLWCGPVVGDGIGAVDAAGPRARAGGRRGDAAGRHRPGSRRDGRWWRATQSPTAPATPRRGAATADAGAGAAGPAGVARPAPAAPPPPGRPGFRPHRSPGRPPAATGHAPGRDPLDDWRMRVQGLGDAIERAESLTLDWPRLGPAVPAYRARAGDLVALGSAAELAGGTLQPGEGAGDDEWLPADLRQLAGPLPVSEPPPVARLYRLLPATAGAAADGGRGAPRLPSGRSPRSVPSAGPPTSTARPGGTARGLEPALGRCRRVGAGAEPGGLSGGRPGGSRDSRGRHPERRSEVRMEARRGCWWPTGARSPSASCGPPPSSAGARWPSTRPTTPPRCTCGGPTRRGRCPVPASAAYLDIDAVVAAARETGCDAVHPGYGFLTENAAFARRCAEAGLVVRRPLARGARAVRRQGRRPRPGPRAAACRCWPGTDGPTVVEEAAAFLDALGDGGAVMIKAVAGGGGRGMRVVTRPEDLEEAYARCRSEALGRVRQRRRLRRAADAPGPPRRGPDRRRRHRRGQPPRRAGVQPPAPPPEAGRDRAGPDPARGAARASCSTPRCAWPPRCATPASAPSSSW